MKNKVNVYAVIMAGGIGSRFWPRSRERSPKQLLEISGGRTMIQNTVMRLLPIFEPQDIYVVTVESSAELLIDQLPLIPRENFILEPFGKNTAPCIALAMTQRESRYSDDTIMIAFPSDHIIYNLQEFHHSLEVAAEVAARAAA